MHPTNGGMADISLEVYGGKLARETAKKIEAIRKKE